MGFFALYNTVLVPDAVFSDDQNAKASTILFLTFTCRAFVRPNVHHRGCPWQFLALPSSLPVRAVFSLLLLSSAITSTATVAVCDLLKLPKSSATKFPGRIAGARCGFLAGICFCCPSHSRHDRRSLVASHWQMKGCVLTWRALALPLLRPAGVLKSKLTAGQVVGGNCQGCNETVGTATATVYWYVSSLRISRRWIGS